MTDGADTGTTVSSRLTGAVMQKGELMIDLISRQDALDEIRRFSGYLDEDMITRIYIGINRLPSTQSEIIRRKDCKHWKKTAEVIDRKSWSIGDCDIFKKRFVMCEGFCAWAERRTDEQNISE